jgi:hypothetical protein
VSVTIKEPYVIGEKSSPLTYQFQDSGGAAIDITGYTAKFQYQEHDGSATVVSATVTDGPNGKVTYIWTGSEFTTAGRYRAQFWAGNGTNRFASTDILFEVALPVGPVPSI